MRIVERKVFSQNGEDGIIESILSCVRVANQVLLEVGVGTGAECNTRRLVEQDGWTGVWADIFPPTWEHARIPKGVAYVQKMVEPSNVGELLALLPPRIGLLSIDIDGNDLWVWKAMGPIADVVVMEYNAFYPPPASKTVRYEPGLQWKVTKYFGASLSALHKAGREMGYELACCDSTGVNAFFVHRDKIVEPLSPAMAYRTFIRGAYPDDPRPMEDY